MSDLAQDIVDKVFAGDKSATVDSVGNAIQDRAYEMIQQKKVEIAKQWGFELDDTAQEVADELADSLPDGSDPPEDVTVDGRMPHDPPGDTEELETTQAQDTENETDLGTD